MSATLNRRSLLKGALAAGATVVAAPVGAAASEASVDPENMVGLLYDATRCVGCKACVSACREANDVAYAPGNTLHYDNVDLSANAKTVIKLYDDDGQSSFMKMQCMHCIDPACTTACMFGALHKDEQGIVTWTGDACVGCRYCEIACPFNVPRFEWESANPEIVKCELCQHRIQDGGIPACAEVCPRDAVTYGTRTELLAEAHRRMDAAPGVYQPKVYGEHDGGGTQVLYLSGIEFGKLGLPELGDRPVPEMVRKVQGAVYKGFVAPIALYGILSAAIVRNRRKEAAAEGDHTGGDA